MRINLTVRLPLFLACLTLATSATAFNRATMTGEEIVRQVYERHEQFPYVYEEQVMILIDKVGNKDARTLRRFSRAEQNGNTKNLILFDSPAEVRGVGLITSQMNQDAPVETHMYLPAFGPDLLESVGESHLSNFLGTDFSISDLLPEDMEQYRYQRQDNVLIDNIEHFIVDVFKRDGSSQPTKRHYVRADIFFITRTENFDRHGRLQKRQSRHNLKPLGGHLWRANMILMEDMRTRHQSLIKISKRVFSKDYVPETVFTLDWLIDNQSSHDSGSESSKHITPDESVNAGGAS